MRLSIITTITNPTTQQYAWKEAIENYLLFADEVIVVDGISTDGSEKELDLLNKNYSRLTVVKLEWPQDTWHWYELPKHLNAGLAAATGDIVLKLDIDQFLHEKDQANFNEAIKRFAGSNRMIGTMVKQIVMNKDHYYTKCEAPYLINKKAGGPSIQFGKSTNAESDYCYPIFVENTDGEVPEGRLLGPEFAFRTGISVWTYDYAFRTKEVAKERFWKFAEAYSTINKDAWGKDAQDSWDVFLKQELGRLQKQLLPLANPQGHPSVLKERLENLKEEEFLFNNWGLPETYEELLNE